MSSRKTPPEPADQLPAHRPVRPVAPGATVVKARLWADERLLERLDSAAERHRRTRTAEVAVAVEAYLDAYPKRLPEAGDVDTDTGFRTLRLPGDLVRRLDAAGGTQRRTAQILAAVRWWIAR